MNGKPIDFCPYSHTKYCHFRYRHVPTFGHGTIRRFGRNASDMKKLAARDFEDLLQCSIPVFEALLPLEFENIISNLLFELCTWHALAKLRLQTETTIQALEHSTQRLGFALRTFEKTICAHYITKELPREEAARGRRTAALAKKKNVNNSETRKNQTKSGAKEWHFNLSTYKLHALADYPAAIRRYGTTDGFTTQVVGCFIISDMLRLIKCIRAKRNIKSPSAIIPVLLKLNTPAALPNNRVGRKHCGTFTLNTWP